jgi:hypothetical protein
MPREKPMRSLIEEAKTLEISQAKPRNREVSARPPPRKVPVRSRSVSGIPTSARSRNKEFGPLNVVRPVSNEHENLNNTGNTFVKRERENRDETEGSGFLLSRSLNRDHRRIVPLHESPKIFHLTSRVCGIEPKLLKFDSDSDGLESAPASDPVIEEFLTELKEFESRFGKYVALIGGNDRLSRFMNEIRATHRALKSDASTAATHFARLKELMKQVENKLLESRAHSETEQRLQEVRFALDLLVKHIETMNSESLRSEVDAIGKRLDNLLLGSGVANELKKLEEIRGNLMECINEKKKSEGRKRIGGELADLQKRILAVVTNIEVEGDRSEELKALVVRQGELIQELSAIG